MRYIETRDVPLAELSHFPGNANVGDVPAIQASIRALDQYRSLVVRRTPGALVVLAGNHTMDALAGLDREAGRCEVIECTDAEALKINLADNRLASLAHPDDEALAALLMSLEGDLAGTGFTESEIERLLSTDLPPGFPEIDESAADGAVSLPQMVTCPECEHVFDANAVTTHG